ncbi:MAG: DsrE/DsrF/TusD sulfur relay family protein [Gemmatimonadaceae bacterium]
MKTLLIINDPPYGTERIYNALRLATTLLKRGNEDLKVFLLADAASESKAGQVVPSGYYSVERMLRVIRSKGAEIGVCGSCMDARGLQESELIEGTHRSTMEELADWTVGADKVIVF